jgi:hypothetical protein
MCHGTCFFVQVLVDTILQLEEVIRFKRRVQAGQQQDVNTTNSGRYVTQLLSKVTPDQVQSTLTRSLDAWTQAFSEAITPLPMLLDLVRRNDHPGIGGQAAYLPIAEQQLNKVCAAALALALHCSVHLHGRLISRNAPQVSPP